MSRANEVVSMLTAGVGLPRVLLPLIAIGLFTVAASMALNYSLAPHAELARKTFLSEAQARPARNIQGQVFRNELICGPGLSKAFATGTAHLTMWRCCDRMRRITSSPVMWRARQIIAVTLNMGLGGCLDNALRCCRNITKEEFLSTLKMSIGAKRHSTRQRERASQFLSLPGFGRVPSFEFGFSRDTARRFALTCRPTGSAVDMSDDDVHCFASWNRLFAASVLWCVAAHCSSFFLIISLFTFFSRSAKETAFLRGLPHGHRTFSSRQWAPIRLSPRLNREAPSFHRFVARRTVPRGTRSQTNGRLNIGGLMCCDAAAFCAWRILLHPVVSDADGYGVKI